MFNNITLDGLYRLSRVMTEKQKEDFFPKVFEQAEKARRTEWLMRIVAGQFAEIERRRFSK